MTDASGPTMTCSSCSYDISGLPADGACPECGFAIEQNSLHNADTTYLTLLQTGLKFIIFGTLVQIAFSLLSLVGSFIAGQMGGNASLIFGLFTSLVGVALGVLILLGWWKFSEPDPSYTGPRDGSTARKWVRIAVLVLAGAMAVSLLGQLLLFVTLGLAALLLFVAGLASLAAGIAQLIAGIFYVKWMAPRLHSGDLYKTAKRNVWLVPLLYLLILPAIVGLVLYLLMLNKTKTLIDDILATKGGAPASA